MIVSPIVDYESTIIERLMISREAAQAMLSIKFSADDQERMQILMDKNNKGDISDAEQAEIECYRRIGNLLGIMQARARLYLKHHPT